MRIRFPALASLALTAAFAATGRGDDAPVAQGVPPVQPAPAGGPRTDAPTPPAPPTATAPVPETGPGGFRRTEEGLLEFHARSLDVAEAFAQLRRLMKKNIVVSPDVKVRFTGDLYDVTLAQAVDAICKSAGLMMREESGFLFVEPTAMKCRIFRLSYARAADLMPMLEPMLSPKGKLTATGSAQRGIKASQDDAGGDDYAQSDTIIANDFPGNLDAIEGAIRAIDGRPKQILMEATLLEANVEDGTSMGVEFKALDGIDFRSVGGQSVGGQNLALGQLPAKSLDDTITSAATNLLTGLPQGGLSFGILKNDVAVFVKALATTTDVRVMANPKVICLNKQRGEVIVGRRDGYLTTTTTTTSTTQKVEFIETGTRLLFRPFVGEDGMIRLEIHPEDSNGGVSQAGLPFKETVEVTTNILVAPGKTVVIGGLFRDRTTDTESKVPFLGDIPLAGNLFKSSTKTKRRQEILILLTPRLVDPAEGWDEEGGADEDDGDEDGAARAAPSATDGVTVVDPDDHTRAKKALETERAAAAASRAETERMQKQVEASRLAVAADVQRAVDAARAAAAIQDEERKKAADASRAAQEAKDEQAKRAAEENAAEAQAKAAEAAAAELEQQLAKARETARAARETKAVKSAETEEAAKKTETLKAEEAARIENAARAAKAAEDARKAAEAAQAQKIGAQQETPVPPAEK